MRYPRPRVVVSRCIEHEACRYNGALITDEFVARLKRWVDFVPVCPEKEIGLGVPRDPVRVVATPAGRTLYQPMTGRDVTREMEAFTADFLGGLGEVHGFILKHRSPSCGPGDVKVFNGRDPAAAAVRGPGMFAAAVLERFGGLAIEDEGRLRNFDIREHFLTKLYALAELGKVRRGGDMRLLVDFHARHKLLLLGYDEARMRAMGRVVANHERLPFAQVTAAYAEQLQAAMARPPRASAVINVLQHAVGGVSQRLSPAERRFFQRSVEEYRDERIPLSAVLRLLESYAVRFENEFLLTQALLHPHPKELVEVRDSGKGARR